MNPVIVTSAFLFVKLVGLIKNLSPTWIRKIAGSADAATPAGIPLRRVEKRVKGKIRGTVQMRLEPEGVKFKNGSRAVAKAKGRLLCFARAELRDWRLFRGVPKGEMQVTKVAGWTAACGRIQ